MAVESSGGELLWAHPHNFDLITYFVGLEPVAWVRASMSFDPSAFDNGVLDADPVVETCTIKFEGGRSASISTTGHSLLRLHCADAELVLGGYTSWLQHTPRETGSHNYPEPQHEQVGFSMSGRQRALHDLVEAVEGRSSSPHSPDDIVRSNELGIAAAWSAVRGGESVRLDDVPSDFVVTGRKGDLYV